MNKISKRFWKKIHKKLNNLQTQKKLKKWLTSILNTNFKTLLVMV